MRMHAESEEHHVSHFLDVDEQREDGFWCARDAGLYSVKQVVEADEDIVMLVVSHDGKTREKHTQSGEGDIRACRTMMAVMKRP
jgi:hypothetical protein